MVIRAKENNKSKDGDKEHWVGLHIIGRAAKNLFNLWKLLSSPFHVYSH